MSRIFVDKLVNFEVQPPRECWERLAGEFTELNDLLVSSNRLSEFEVPPPTGVFEIILKTIQDDKPVPAAKQPKSSKKIIRYLLAAAVLAGTAVIITLFAIYNPLVRSTLNSNKIAQTPGKIIPGLQQPVPSNNDAADQVAENESLAFTSRLVKPNAKSGRVLRNTIVKNALFPSNDLQILIPAKPIRSADGEVIQDPHLIKSPGSAYISITSPSGQQTKISSKFLHMLLFINDDSDIDQVDGYFDKNFLESLIWKSRFNDWRNQILSRTLVPTSTNFMDILDLKELLTTEN